ncbi:MAG: STAS domain-containing protein [Acidimicrobiales bacterium]
MRALESPSGQDDLARLIAASAQARIVAASAVAHSRELAPRITEVRVGSAASHRQRRPHFRYAVVEGMIDGQPVAAVVRRDGTVDGDRTLVGRAGLVVAMGDAFDDGRVPAALYGDPLAAVLTLTRACDKVRSVQVDLPGAVAMRPAARAARSPSGSGWAPDPAMVDSRSDPMPGPSFRIELASDGEHRVVRLHGELDVAYAAPLRAALVGVAGSSVVVDLAQLTFLDASGLAALLAARQVIVAGGHEMRLQGAGQAVRRVFEITELVELLDR